jgi:hypothetical protein
MQPDTVGRPPPDDIEGETSPHPRRLSEIVASLAGRNDMTVGEIVALLGERAFGALMFVFAIPNIVPTPPGTSAVLGLPLIILAWQLATGRQSLWLPAKLRARAIDGALVSRVVTKAVPALSALERFLAQRFGFFVMNNAAERVIGLVALGLAVILFLPIPFANILPAASIALLALGLAERDGLAVLLGYLVAAASLTVLVLVWSALYAAVVAFVQVLFGL